MIFILLLIQSILIGGLFGMWQESFAAGVFMFSINLIWMVILTAKEGELR